jgi:hypothetical protein
MFLRMLAIFSALAITAPMLAEDSAVHPFKSAKVGDYTVMKMESPQVKMTTRQEISAVDPDKSVTLKITTTINGMAPSTTEQKIDLTKKFDPTGKESMPKDAKLEELGTGKETVKLGDKSYECEWRKMKITVKAGGMDIVTETKVWTSKAVPLNGFVKMENTAFGQTTTMELVESSAKK